LGAGDRVGLVGKTELEIYHAKMLAKILLLTQVFSRERSSYGSYARISILSRVELFLKPMKLYRD
jgi:hypothetical protein